MKQGSLLTILALFALSTATLADEQKPLQKPLKPLPAGAKEIAGKEAAKCSSEKCALGSCCKEGKGEKAVLTAECVEKLVAALKKESCPVKSREILASALPGLKCEKTLDTLAADVKAKDCCSEAGKLILAAFEKYGAAQAKTVSLSAECADKLVAALKKESCPVKSREILASALPGLKCEKTLDTLAAEVKAKECSKEGGKLILAAFEKHCAAKGSCDKSKTVSLSAECAEKLVAALKKESCPVKSREILASALPGLKCEKTLEALAAGVKATECSKEGGKLILAAFEKHCAAKEKETTTAAGKLCAKKAETLAAAVRGESCCERSLEILAEALPEITCKETLASLAREIKQKGCEKEATEAILAAFEKFAAKKAKVTAD